MARSIRPRERDDLEQVAALYEHVARSGSRTPPSGLARLDCRTSSGDLLTDWFRV